MKILVTGASGFLGTNLCKALLEKGHLVVALNSKIADLRIGGTLKAFNNQSYDQIYHLAAWTQAGDFCLMHPGEQWVINQQINTNLLAWWSQDQPQAKLIAIGTSCAYAPDMELTEDNYLLGLPIESLSTYAMTKRMLYVGLIALQKQFGLRYLYVVPSTLYGPGYHTDGRQMHFVFDLIRKILAGKICGVPPVLWGDGYQKRELVYIDDFVNAMLELEEKCDNEIVNIGAGEEFTIRQFAQTICELVGYDYEMVKFDTSRYVGARSKCLNIRKLKNLIPSYSTTNLEQGLRQTIDWFLDHTALLHQETNVG